MHGLADIRHINNAVLNDEVARRKRLAKKASDDVELAEAKHVYRWLRLAAGSQENSMHGRAADLIDAAYGVSED